jgi:hypothetical protein
MKETRKVWESLPSEKHQQLEKKEKKCSGKITRSGSSSKQQQQQKGNRQQAAAGFQGVPDDRQAHSRFSGLQQVSGVPDDRQAHSGFSGFQQSSGFADFILESANRDSDLDTLDKEASRGALMPEKSGSTESEWWEEKTGQAEGCHG